VDAGEYTLRVELPDGSYQAVEIVLRVTGNVNLNVRLVSRGIQVTRVEIVAPPGDGPNGSYLTGKSYPFRAKAFDLNGNELSGLLPNWSIEGGVGTISSDGVFTATSPGTGRIVATFTETKFDAENITVSQPPSPNAVLLIGSSRSAPLRDVLLEAGFDVTMRPDVPATLDEFAVTIIDQTGDISQSDAAKVENALNTGKAVVLIGEAPALLATGQLLPATGQEVNISSISTWFAGATTMKLDNRDLRAGDPRGLFPLPPGVAAGQTLYSPGSYDESKERMAQVLFITVGTVIAETSPTWGRRVYAFAHRSPETGARLYWQWHYAGSNPNYIDRVRALFVAAVQWAAGVETL